MTEAIKIILGIPSKKIAQNREAACRLINTIDKKEGEKRALDALHNIGSLLGGRPNGVYTEHS